MPSETVYIHTDAWDELNADAKRAGVKTATLVSGMVRFFYGHESRVDQNLKRIIFDRMARASSSPKSEAIQVGMSRKR